MKNIKFNLK